MTPRDALHALEQAGDAVRLAAAAGHALDRVLRAEALVALALDEREALEAAQQALERVGDRARARKVALTQMLERGAGNDN